MFFSHFLLSKTTQAFAPLLAVNKRSSSVFTTFRVAQFASKQSNQQQQQQFLHQARPSVVRHFSQKNDGTESTSSGSKDEKRKGGGGRVSSAVQDKNVLAKTERQAGRNKKQQQALDTNPPKGTRDFYPSDKRLQTWLFSHWRDVAASFGFQEYDAPVLESQSLYTRKAGEDVTQQLYNFADKGNRPVALRPEMTPSLARMVLKQKKSLSYPLKWFAIPQCWRYEQTTRGRRREHYQWNMDIWGVDSVTAEVELLSAMVTFFQRVGITSEDVGIKINSRNVIKELLVDQMGVPPEKFAATCVLVDKLEKVPIDALSDELNELGLDRSLVENLLEQLSSCKHSLDALEKVLGPDSQAIQQLKQVFQLLEAYGMADWVQLDASVVRGLSYYTGIVFEAFDRRGQLRAIAGGGRYDTLLQTFGSDEGVPAVGFGFGDAVIVELLKECNKLPSFDTPDFIDVVVFGMTPDMYSVAVQVATQLRNQNNNNNNDIKVDLVLEQSKRFKWVMKHADRMGVKHVIIVAPDEYELTTSNSNTPK